VKLKKASFNGAKGGPGVWGNKRQYSTEASAFSSKQCCSGGTGDTSAEAIGGKNDVTKLQWVILCLNTGGREGVVSTGEPLLLE